MRCADNTRDRTQFGHNQTIGVGTMVCLWGCGHVWLWGCGRELHRGAETPEETEQVLPCGHQRPLEGGHHPSTDTGALVAHQQLQPAEAAGLVLVVERMEGDVPLTSSKP